MWLLDDELPRQFEVGTNTPGATSTLFFKQMADWRMLRHLMEGTRRVREQTIRYLPRHYREPHDLYNERLSKAVFTNYLRDAVMNVVGRPFSRKVSLQSETPPAIKEWENNIDLRGTTLHNFARQFFYNAIHDGMAHVIVDHSRLPEGATLADEKALQSRSYLIQVPATNLIAAYKEEVGGHMRCVHARIMEQQVVREGFCERIIHRVRVYEPGYYWIYTNQNNTNWDLIEEGPMTIAGQPLEYVPLFTFYAGQKIDDYWCVPPFLDLAFKNIEHYQLSSDDAHARSRSNFAMLGVKDGENTNIEGLDKEMIVGADAILKGDWYYVEPKGMALESNDKALKRLEQEMEMMGMAPLQTRMTGQATATETMINSADCTSTVKEWTISFSDILNEALDFMTNWDGYGPGVTRVMVNSDFQISNGSTDMPTLMQMRGTGDLSRETLYEEAQRRGLLSPTFDSQLEIARLAAEQPMMMPDGSMMDEFGNPILDQQDANQDRGMTNDTGLDQEEADNKNDSKAANDDMPGDGQEAA